MIGPAIAVVLLAAAVPPPIVAPVADPVTGQPVEAAPIPPEPPAPAEPPAVRRLFNCALEAHPSGFEPRERWQRRPIEALGVAVTVPAGWTIEGGGPVWSVRSPSGRTELSLRMSPRATVAETRRALELLELGPTHAGAWCERAVATRLSQVTGLTGVGVGVYRKSLAKRRRRYALYAPVGGGALAVLLTARWRRDDGPDLEVVRRVLGGVRPLVPVSRSGSETAGPPG